MYPRLLVNLNKLRHNINTMINLGSKYGINITAVTKVFCADREIVKAILDCGIKSIGDSRIQNLKKIKDYDVKKILLRIPMEWEIEDVIDYSDISLNSELYTIGRLSEEAIKKGKVHDIILMVDVGDLREGVLPKEVIPTVEEILKMKGVRLIGLGTNLTCYGGVIPTVKNIGQLSNIAIEIEKRFNIELKIISGGNSSSIYLLEQGIIPRKINNLRLGEAIVLGTEAAYGRRIPDTYDDVFTMYAQIIELKEKPSIPIGKIELDAFGNKPVFVDRGIRKRAILGIGKQDIYHPEKLIPIDNGVIVLGASSDHLIVDITDCSRNLRVGDVVGFKLKYPALLQLFTSPYVYKEIID